MTHSDDNGLVLPPMLALFQVVIVPIFKNQDELALISDVVEKLKSDFMRNDISVKFDNRDKIRPGEKFALYEIQGVPIRLTLGPKDLMNKTVEIFRRDSLTKDTVKIENSVSNVSNLLKEMQKSMYNNALSFRDNNITEVDNFDDFKQVLNTKGGFISAHWDGTEKTENEIKKITKATIRCIPFGNQEVGSCVFSGNQSKQRVLFAKAY